MSNYKIIILHNIISPYKTLLFNELYKLCNDIKILYMAEKESNREWEIKKDELKFPYEIMFKEVLDDVSPLTIAIETWKRLNTLNPDVLIMCGYSYVSYWAGLFWAKKNKKKIILWSASNEDDHKRVFYKEFIKSFFVRRCDAYSVYGKRSRDYLIKLGAKEDKIFIVGTNTDNDFYYNETMKWRKERSTLVKNFGIPERNFLYIGRFSHEKNILRLLDAYRDLKCGEEWGLILLGSGPQKEEIERYIEAYQIKNVFMPGFKQKEEIPQYLAVSDVLVLPSVSEPWGLVVNEAMACGLPVLVSHRCGCVPELVHPGINGYMFDPFNIDEIAYYMTHISSGEVELKSMGEASKRIITNYTPEAWAKALKDCIEVLTVSE